MKGDRGEGWKGEETTLCVCVWGGARVEEEQLQGRGKVMEGMRTEGESGGERGNSATGQDWGQRGGVGIRVEKG